MASSSMASLSPASALRQRPSRSSPPAAKSTTVDAHLPPPSQAEVPSTFTPPNFTVKDLLGAIPKHCFERSALRSGSYLLLDLVLLGVFAFLASHIDALFGVHGSAVSGPVFGRAAQIAAWTLYVVCAGSVGTGVWVIAHECGHQAFSASKTINNAVGWVFHSALLVPYHSWRISHARHHAATGSMERDEVFVPKTRSQLGLPSADEVAAAQHSTSTFEALDELFEDAPLWNFVNIVLQQLFGFPMYLARNVSGQAYAPTGASHFNPTSPIFDKRHFWQIVASDIGLAITVGTLAIWGVNRGFAEVLKFYILPYLVVNHHLVMITYLQHSDRSLPHYRKGEWTFPRGALCTIDRELYGPFGDWVFHSITNTHVLHHICSRIPHYHGHEATEALKSMLGEHYMYSSDNIYRALWRSYSQCKFVEDEGSCVFYKNNRGKAQRRVVYEEDSGVGGLSDGSASGEEPDMEVDN